MKGHFHLPGPARQSCLRISQKKSEGGGLKEAAALYVAKDFGAAGDHLKVNIPEACAIGLSKVFPE